MKNHLQLEELQMSEEERFDKIIGRNSRTSNLPGIETPLGHAYSIILEELAKEGIDTTPDLSSFLKSIKQELISRGYLYESKYTDLTSPSYYGRETNGIMKYMLKKGLSHVSCEKIMRRILGPGCGVTYAPEYRAENIKRFFK
ncbi:MAG: hypothetical protein AABW81_00010 [Nanoarchaeota archaeon]